jgi:hypothetical protein
MWIVQSNRGYWAYDKQGLAFAGGVVAWGMQLQQQPVASANRQIDSEARQTLCAVVAKSSAARQIDQWHQSDRARGSDGQRQGNA